MNCHEMKERLHDLLDGTLEEGEQRALERHLAGCAACARSHDELRALDAWARDLAPIAPAPGFADRVLARIEAEPAPAVLEEQISIALPLAISAAVVAVALPLLHAAWMGCAAALAATYEYLGAAVSDFSALGREASAAVAPFTSALADARSVLPGLWLSLAIVAVFAIVIAFNVAQTRARTRAQRI